MPKQGADKPSLGSGIKVEKPDMSDKRLLQAIKESPNILKALQDDPEVQEVIVGGESVLETYIRETRRREELISLLKGKVDSLALDARRSEAEEQNKVHTESLKRHLDSQSLSDVRGLTRALAQFAEATEDVNFTLPYEFDAERPHSSDSNTGVGKWVVDGVEYIVHINYSTINRTSFHITLLQVVNSKTLNLDADAEIPDYFKGKATEVAHCDSNLPLVPHIKGCENPGCCHKR